METKGITCKIPLELHQQLKEEQEHLGLTMNQYIEMVLCEHFTPKGEVNMGKTRTLAFQVSEELFEKVKEYLTRYEQAYGRRLTQKEFVISLIENALEEAEDEFTAIAAEALDDDPDAECEDTEQSPEDEDSEGSPESQAGAEPEPDDSEAPDSEDTEQPPEDEDSEGSPESQAGAESEPDDSEAPDSEDTEQLSADEDSQEETRVAWQPYGWTATH